MSLARAYERQRAVLANLQTPSSARSKPRLSSNTKSTTQPVPPSMTTTPISATEIAERLRAGLCFKGHKCKQLFEIAVTNDYDIDSDIQPNLMMISGQNTPKVMG